MSTDTDLNLLVALRVLLEEANVTRAGERIGAGQSTMSSALSRLRTVFQDELLVRVGRDYELTPLARQILPQIQATLPLVAQALGQEEQFDPATSERTFRIQLSDFGSIRLQPLFAAATHAAPGVNFAFRKLTDTPSDADRPLLSTDFIIAAPGIGIDGDSMELYREDYVVVADKDNPAVASGEISLQDFETSPAIRCDFGREHMTPAERRMRELDIRQRVRVTTSALLTIPLIVSGTDLISVVPRRLVQLNERVANIVAVPTPFPTVQLIQRMWWHPAHEYDGGHRWFREVAAAAVRDGIIAA